MLKMRGMGWGSERGFKVSNGVFNREYKESVPASTGLDSLFRLRG